MSVQLFIDEMNKKANSLGMRDTYFTNGHGLGNDQSITVRDAIILAIEVHNDPSIKEIWGKEKHVIHIKGEFEREIVIYSSWIDRLKSELKNEWNDYEILGGKSSSLTNPNVCNLVQLGRWTNSNSPIIMVVLGAKENSEKFNLIKKNLQFVFDGKPLDHTEASYAVVKLNDNIVGEIIASNNLDSSIPPGSIVKIMTSLVTIDFVSNLDESFAIINSDIKRGSGSKLYPGDILTFRDALYLGLIESSNTAMQAISRVIGGRMERKQKSKGIGWLTTEIIYEILGLMKPAKFENMVYRNIKTAFRAKENDVVILETHISRTEENLADVAIKKGATLLIATKQIRNYPCLIVDNIKDAYVKLCRYRRDMFSVQTVAVIGSIGKTTTKDLIASALGKSETHASPQSFNVWTVTGDIIQGINKSHQFYVQEVSEGSNTGTNAETCSQMINPNVAVITKISQAHMESFGTVENIIKACFGITKDMDEDGILVINGDDPYQVSYQITHKTLSYAIENPEADFRAINIEYIYDVENLGISFTIAHKDERTSLRINHFGKHNVYCALAAFATAKILGLSDVEIQNNIRTSKPNGIRSRVVNCGKNSLYIDCYNAEYISMKAAIETLSLFENKQQTFKRIAVLADINELGEEIASTHQKIGQVVLDSKIDVLICFGSLSKIIADTVKEKPSIKVFHTESIDEASISLLQVVEPHDIILFKGSRSMKLERMVDDVFKTSLAKVKSPSTAGVREWRREKLQLISEKRKIENELKKISDIVQNSVDTIFGSQDDKD